MNMILKTTAAIATLIAATTVPASANQFFLFAPLQPVAAPVQTAQGPFVQSGSCFYWLHAHANDGIIHIESPSTTMQFTLGQFFKIWGIPLSSNRVGPATGRVTAFLTYKGHHDLVTGIYNGDPANLPLGNHYQIQLDVGTPIVAPYKVTNWGGL